MKKILVIEDDKIIINIIEFLLKKGANINAKDKFGATPLHLAAISGYTDSVKVLLEKK